MSPKETSTMYVSAVNDMNTQTPFHVVLLQKQDTLVKYDFWNQTKSLAQANLSELEHQDTLMYETGEKHTYIAPFYLFKDLVMFERNSYVKTKKGQKLSSKTFKSLVEDKIYSTDIPALKTPNSAFDIRETLHFNNQKITYVWEYFYAGTQIHSENETVDYQIFDVNQQLFIIPSTQDNPYPMYQVSKVNASQIDLSYFIDYEVKTKSYITTDSLPKHSASTYQLCRDAFQSLYYVGDEVRYSKGMEHLKQYLQDGAPLANNDGFINLHFTINCQGQVGRFGLELLNTKYEPTDFKPELVSHIVQKVKKIRQWDNLGKVTYRGAKDVKMFFLVKIRNQKIVDVCP